MTPGARGVADGLGGGSGQGATLEPGDALGLAEAGGLGEAAGEAVGVTAGVITGGVGLGEGAASLVSQGGPPATPVHSGATGD